ncbi:hypothetical protein TraAM80_00665 [Trypanosoma rangeli]|uniref:Uncharacterized protein n=1 Tax=Trypanosoma rangeli TaxID=5698 RepID=A0A3R7P2R3_TRYRA|nr:uncharacterized protein TraAM80_00665 [Trypanosoma rangeli]RNF11831.1 hypothetical protein TraAM80_00665 [Trypanosoma rangeli]|eukprot:RNF11831.1 hypothetical protein TraAM80_00665 [Trypanosoma rangeli]
MPRLSEEEEKLARAALEENDTLRRILQDSPKGGYAHEEATVMSVDKADSVFTLKRGNDILKGEIVALQYQLDASDVSAAETVHKFNQLQSKRAHLRNETRSLENIANHQAPKVKEANRIVLNQLAMKRSCDEKNRALREEVKRLKEFREKGMERLYAALRKEAHLKEQLENTNLALHSSDCQVLKNAILSKDKTIRMLKEEIEKARITQGKQTNYGNEYYDDTLAKLRKEHDDLCEQIQALQMVLQR